MKLSDVNSFNSCRLFSDIWLLELILSRMATPSIRFLLHPVFCKSFDDLFDVVRIDQIDNLSVDMGIAVPGFPVIRTISHIKAVRLKEIVIVFEPNIVIDNLLSFHFVNRSLPELHRKTAGFNRDKIIDGVLQIGS